MQKRKRIRISNYPNTEEEEDKSKISIESEQRDREITITQMTENEILGEKNTCLYNINYMYKPFWENPSNGVSLRKWLRKQIQGFRAFDQRLSCVRQQVKLPHDLLFSDRFAKRRSCWQLHPFEVHGVFGESQHTLAVLMTDQLLYISPN